MLALQPKSDFIFIPNKNSPFASPEDKLKVNFLDAIFRRALTKYFMDSLKSAFTDFQTCIDRDYELKSNCYLWQGSIYARVGNKQKACELYSQGRFYAKDHEELGEAERLIKNYCK